MIIKKDKKKLRAIVIIGLIICLLVAIPDLGVVLSTSHDIKGNLNYRDDEFTSEEIEELKSIEPQCIIVLGASVKSDGSPSKMLRQRLNGAIQLYEAGVAPKILLTGDNANDDYNELSAMLAYVRYFGVPKEDVFCDYAGFSTYESAYRAKEIFQVERAIVVTQRYHLYRSIYGCKQMSITTLGAATDQERYVGQSIRDARELLARYKDFFKWIARPEPTYLGDPIPITGDGDDSRVLE